jgi:F0F1-type ATP synthase assembly protein I
MYTGGILARRGMAEERLVIRLIQQKQAGQPGAGVQSELGQAVMLGMNCAVGMAVFTFLGYLLDRKLDTRMVFTLIGMVLGLGYLAYEVWKVVRFLNAQAGELLRQRNEAAGGEAGPRG